MNTQPHSAQALSDQEFMTQVYRNYSRLMFYTAKQHTDDPRQCEDIVQDSLTRLIEKVDTLRGCSEKALASYITVTVRNTSINHLKHRKREQAGTVTLDETDNTLLDAAPTLEEYLILREKLDQLSKLWPLVDEEVRFLLEGKYILEYDDKQLAEMLGCQPDSIRMKLTRARRKALNVLKEGGLDG